MNFVWAWDVSRGRRGTTIYTGTRLHIAPTASCTQWLELKDSDSVSYHVNRSFKNVYSKCEHYEEKYSIVVIFIHDILYMIYYTCYHLVWFCKRCSLYGVFTNTKITFTGEARRKIWMSLSTLLWSTATYMYDVQIAETFTSWGTTHFQPSLTSGLARFFPHGRNHMAEIPFSPSFCL